jgi:hypothetical protein
MRRPFRQAVFVSALLLGCSTGERAPALEQKSESPTSPAPSRVALDEATNLAAPSGAAVATGTVDAEPGSLPDAAHDPAAATAMIIRSGNASLEIDSLELAVARVRALADRVGGFVANSQMQAGREQLRSATLELRVPAARFDELITGLTPIGRVEYVNINAQDVGEEYTDVAARVANSHRLEARLIDLLATRTGKLSDVLEIERELARVREEIERMEGRLRYLRAHAATSSLSVTVHEKAPLVGEQGSGSVIGEAFRQAWRNFVNFLARLIASLGTLLPLAVIVLAALLGLRSLWRARRTD